MQYKRLGRSGLRVSNLALGSWLTFGGKVDREGTKTCVRAAIEGGITFFDTADVYSYGQAEIVLGHALEGIPRNQLVLASKCYFPMSDHPNDRGLSRKHVTESLHGSLRRLRTDYVDLYQCHRHDQHTPLEELVQTMGMLLTQGKILYWGVSCWSAEQIREVCRLADRLLVPRPISNQPPYSLLERQIDEEVVPACLEEGLGQIVFSPLAQGLLTGKYSQGEKPKESRATQERGGLWIRPWLKEHILASVDRLRPIADELDLTLAQLALAWCWHKPGVDSVIFGASSVGQVENNLRSADVKLTDEDVTAIEMAIGDVRLRCEE